MIVRFLDFIDRMIARLEEVIMAAGVMLMAVNTVANVISRFVFDHSIIFAEEMNSILILLVTFAGIGYAARHGRHIRMSAIHDAMPLAARRIAMVVISMGTGIIMIALSYFAVEYILSIYSRGRVMPALGVPVYLVYLWVPVGCFVTGFQYLLTAVKNLKGDQVYVSTNLTEQNMRDGGM